MKHFIFLAATIILGLLQATLLDFFRVFQVKPDLLLVIAFFSSLYFNLRWAVFFGLLAGFLKDIFGVNAFGINSLLFVITSILIVRLNKKVTIDNSYMRMALVFIIALAYNIIIGLYFRFLGSTVPTGIFLRIVIVTPVYTALVSLLINRIIKLNFSYE